MEKPFVTSVTSATGVRTSDLPGIWHGKSSLRPLRLSYLAQYLTTREAAGVIQTITQVPVYNVRPLIGSVISLETDTLRRSVVDSVGLFIAITILSGCVSGMASTVRFPIVSGFHDALPPPKAKIVVWGDPRVTGAAAEWLALHHFLPIIAEGPGPKRATASRDRSLALSYARRISVDFVLFLDAELRSGGAIEEPVCRSGRHLDVTAQGVSVASEDVQWSGNAHYTRCVAVSVESWKNLTCQALAAAWGLRPSGQLEIPSQAMCTTGQTEEH